MTSVVVSVGPDSPDNDFGFKPRAEQITNDIALGVLTTTGEDQKFWAKQFRAATRGKGQSEFDASTPQGFLAEIEGLFFESPSQFAEGSELNEALAVLSAKASDPLAELVQELFVTELNHVSGKGLADHDLQAVLISWGESIVVDRQSAAMALPGAAKPMTGADHEIQAGLDLFNAINGVRGGGDVPDEG